MADGMDIEHFRRLAESYGAIIERWPEALRPAARIAAQSLEGQEIIEKERALDETLDLWSVPVLSADLARTTGDKTLASHQKILRRMRLWWTGIGVAAALSGALTGTAATALMWQAPQPYTSTVFGDLDDGDN